MASVRLEWTIDQFFAQSSTLDFAAKLASVLGIPEKRVKIVQVWSGSVGINFQIINPTDQPEALLEIKEKLDEALKSRSSFLGAPILDFDTVIPVPIDESLLAKRPNVTIRTVIIKKNATVVAEEAQQAQDGQIKKLMIIVAVVLTVAIAIGAAIYAIYRKKKGVVVVQVGGVKGDQTTAQQMNISNDYETQYHPKAELGNTVVVFDDLAKQREKHNQDEVTNQDMEEENDQQENAAQNDWNIGTGRTNNLYSEEMSSPTALRGTVAFSDLVRSE